MKKHISGSVWLSNIKYNFCIKHGGRPKSRLTYIMKEEKMNNHTKKNTYLFCTTL